MNRCRYCNTMLDGHHSKDECIDVLRARLVELEGELMLASCARDAAQQELAEVRGTLELRELLIRQMADERKELRRAQGLDAAGVASETMTVCDACGTRTCWEGVLMCENAKTAGTREVPAIPRHPIRGDR